MFFLDTYNLKNRNFHNIQNLRDDNLIKFHNKYI